MMESDHLLLIGEECGEKLGEMARMNRSLDVESGESSTEEVEVESPRSVVVKKKVEWVHSQVLRIREEESHLGEDFLSDLRGLSGKDSKTVVGGSPKRHRVNVVVFSRPILPCSPLSGKNTVKALH
ncbi:hypothetical protein SLEP1_g20309 [Rubroshorea leprosula]|uniref:Uncharacterized protein n=1 Tax=Rubroshorea leprosula TaxID=152421 RepID=A0AAV5J850_9ROSI|nr:hypothetical protein SLEP1_g20309 [Rubroshorea leprosula]